ncbi:class I SAM-dependent methyltransferase [bacterium]|nr:class I SAM-dependent methyltransferase [bacterium]
MRRLLKGLTDLWWRLVAFGFRLLYNELAFTYDLVSKLVSLGAWRCWQRSTLKHLLLPTQSPILELAHGTGNLQLDLKEAGYITFGCDLSPQMGRIAQAKLHRTGQRASFTRNRAQALPFETGVFAAVISTFPTSFIIDPATLHEIRRVLRDDGRLVIVPSGVLTGGDVIARFIMWLYRITGQGEVDGPLAALTRYIAGYGFEVVTATEICPRSRALVIIAMKKV